MNQQAATNRFDDQRWLVIYACGWLLASWGWMLWQDGAVAGVRWMLLNAMFGLMLVWPAWRLSQTIERGQPTIRLVVMDWLYLQLLIQIMLWPLRLTANWSMDRTAAIAALLALWPLLTTVIVAWAWRRQLRCLGMMLCVLLVFAGSLAEIWGILPTSIARWTPLSLLWNLSAVVIDWP